MTSTAQPARPLAAIVLAAGQGTRMKSAKPKVLHEIGNRPILGHILMALDAIGASRKVVVVGKGHASVRAYAEGLGAATAVQDPPLGTGDAGRAALPALEGFEGDALVLYGDNPLLTPATLRALMARRGDAALSLMGFTPADPGAYGRLVLNEAGDLERIVEHKDASAAQRAIREVYTGIMVVPTPMLRRWLGALSNDNAQREYYLTDIVKFAVADGVPVVAHATNDAAQVAGANSLAQLAELERTFQRRQARHLMDAGVRIMDPERLDVRGDLRCGPDVQIDINCIFEGQVELGAGVRIGAHCVLANCRIEAGAVIHPFTHIDGEKQGVTVGEGAGVGPFARLRPGAQLGREVHIGNFVEVKNSSLARGAKANHLAYLGDATVGERVNYGAGSITANYDGAGKHRTVIEADAHIGSNCVLVAPVTIGAGGTVGGGSTITKSTPPGALSVARGKQISVANWQRPRKK